MDDLLREFLTETAESINQLDVELVNLEREPDNPALIASIFRLVHTIKGTCGFLGLPRLEHVAHAAENVLGKFRDCELVVTPDSVSLILASIDRIKSLLAALEDSGQEPAGDDAELIDSLDALASGKAVPVDATPNPARIQDLLTPAQDAEGPFDSKLGRALRPGEVSLDELEAAFQAAAAPQSSPGGVATAHREAAPARQEVARSATDSSLANQTIRVNVDLLENLMTMVSELVLTRNQLLQMVRSLDDSEFTVPLQRLSHVTTELQEGVMKTRMQPIGNAWAKLPRLIRDLSVELGKKIELQMLGQETELDRQVLELIKDPLTHMVRNSADHGLERPQERLKAGKPETGHITLNAFHEGGHIIIEIRDDGRGLDVGRIRAKAIEQGLAIQQELDGMAEQQVLQFIFRPGFSTAAKVTSVSGRGVGMDVVRTNIEKIGGTVDLKSDKGKGTTFTIKIPLTLAIVSALIVECVGERFAIPQISVVELVRVSEDSEHRIERISETPVLRLRDRLLPLVFLDRVLALADEAGSNRKNEAFVVVVQVGSSNFGIVVDRVFDTEEIVVKPVAPILRDIALFSGNTILGDGRVIMILDPNGIAAAAGQQAGGEHDVRSTEKRQVGQSDERTAMLVFRAGGPEPRAVPLALVARLEEFPVERIERSNQQILVQYRGRLMPLVMMEEKYELRSAGAQPILVFADGDRSMGLVVDEIVDIVEDRLQVEQKGRKAGVLGSAVVAGQATEIVDVGYYLQKGFGDWFQAASEGAFGEVAAKRRVLLVDDSPFFRHMLAPMLSVAGYEVTTAADARAALRYREDGQAFDVIISDIEMPGMSGFDFARAVREDERWHATPIVALSSHASARDFERGREAGFSDYVPKSDRDALLQTLSATLAVRGAA
ncbi:MAG: chemotaxis protein CheW [Alphaproteobacteria bacterium]|nr:chemotaxis protein CheW [Alphaproteobacteria bacterium]